VFDKVLIANRGEIAVRIARTCRELGIQTVGVYSTADREPRIGRHFDQLVHIGPAPSRRSYQNVAAVVEAAVQTGADAIHPGYGFLSEDPDFAEVCAEFGITFVGPAPALMGELGDKAAARHVMQAQGLPLLPGLVEPVTTVRQLREIAGDIGFPLIIKAVLGGGGKGMAVIRSFDDLEETFRQARATARSVFGDERVYVERYLDDARHVEVQVLCDNYGNGVHLGTRDCSVQRRHQKLIEEGPAPNLPPAVETAMGEAAVAAALGAGYTGVGTFEFLLDRAANFYFMEINTRIQVEHTVSEVITGTDLVREQLLVAAGNPLPLTQNDIDLTGVAIECRVNGEDPDRGFVPTAGPLTRFDVPGGPFTRVDTHAFTGYVLGPEYDSLIAKLIVWAPDRDQAISRMDRALREFDISGPGVSTTIPFLRRVLAETDFQKASHSTALVDRMQNNWRHSP
jgi:acetyl-CoA carboxylase, biotin carboxylase subunit